VDAGREVEARREQGDDEEGDHEQQYENVGEERGHPEPPAGASASVEDRGDRLRLGELDERVRVLRHERGELGAQHLQDARLAEEDRERGHGEREERHQRQERVVCNAARQQDPAIA
jgi:hypothetical protein